MKISKISGCGCNCDKKTEKGNYTPGPAKGHLDTQLFPESTGTKYDRDVVGKTVKRRKQPKTAARTRQMIGIDSFRGEGGINKMQWDDVYADGKDAYKALKESMATNQNSQFWDDNFVMQDIVQKLVSQGADEPTARLAVQSILAMDSRFRKSKKFAAAYVQIKTAQLEDTIRNMESIFGTEKPQEDTPAPAAPPSYDSVKVIYPDSPEEGKHTEFEIPIPSEISSKGEDEILGYVWRQTNHVDDTEWIADKPYRSSMIGDVYVVGGTNWVVMGIGFAKLPISVEKWLATPKKWKYHSIEAFEPLIHQAFARNFVKTSKKDECEECNLDRTAQVSKEYLTEVDKNTLGIGKITSVNQAKKICKEKNGGFPRPGHEMLIDEGYTEMSTNDPGKVWHGKHKYKYKTYLQNNAGLFRVWSYISPSPGIDNLDEK